MRRRYLFDNIGFISFAVLQRYLRALRHVSRWLLGIAAMISFILFIACCAAWVRSYWASDSIVFFWMQSSNPGGRYGHTSAGYTQGRFEIYHESMWDPSPQGFRRFAFNTNHITETDAGTFKFNYGRQGVSWICFTTLRPKSVTSFTFSGIEVTLAHGIPNLESLLVAEHPSAKIAIGYIAGSLLIGPLLAFANWRRRRLRYYRRLNCLCIQCGYDLRCSPDFCPECGAAPATAITSILESLSLGRLGATFGLAVGVFTGCTSLVVWAAPRAEQRLLARLHQEEALSQELRDAADASALDRVTRLLDRGANPSEVGILHDAVAHGDMSMVRLLLDRGSAVDGLACESVMSDRVHTPLCDSVLSGHTEMIPLLLERGADWRKVAFEDVAAMLLWDHRFNLFREVKDPNATNDAGVSLLHLAAGRMDAVAVKDLVERDADPNAEDDSKHTPLDILLTEPSERHRDYVAPAFADANPVQCLMLLLKRGAKTSDPELPLIYRAAWNPELVAWLIARGEDVNAVAPYDRRPLHQAAGSGEPGSERAAALLIDAGAELEARDREGNTALYGANLEVLRVLLAHHANVNTFNKKHQSPLHVALQWGNIEAARLLIAAKVD